MNSRDLIVLCFTVILLLSIGLFAIYNNSFSEGTVLDMTSDEKLDEGDSLVLKLTDKDGFPVSNQKVEINLTDDDGITENFTMNTDSNGETRLEDMIEGNFSFISKYYGDGDHKESTVTDEITVK